MHWHASTSAFGRSAHGAARYVRGSARRYPGALRAVLRIDRCPRSPMPGRPCAAGPGASWRRRGPGARSPTSARRFLSVWLFSRTLFVVVGLGVVTVVVVVGVIVLLQVPLRHATRRRGRALAMGLVRPRSSGRRPRCPSRSACGGLPVAWSEVGYAVLLPTVLLVVDLVALVLLASRSRSSRRRCCGAPTRPGSTSLAGGSTAPRRHGAPFRSEFALLVAIIYAVTWLACGQAALTRLLLDPPERAPA